MVFSRVIVLSVAITGVLHVVMYLLNTQLPLHVMTLGGSLAQIGWLFAVNTGVAMALRPQVGGWVDRYGARAILLPGAATLVLTMVAFNFAATPAALIALMGGLGIASALISTTGSIVVAAESPPHRRGETLSLYYLASSVGVALGPVVGFALADLGGMRLNFLVSTVLAVAAAGFIAALRTGAGNPAAPRGFQGLWSPHAVGASLALIVITMGHSTVYAFLPLHATALGLGRAAWFFPLMSGCTIVARLLFRRASDTFGRAPVLVPALVALTLGNVLLALAGNVGTLILSAALLGSGNSMLYPTLVALVVDRAPEAERGKAIGTLSGAWDVGVAVGSPLIALLIQARGYSAGFFASAFAVALGLVVFLAAERRGRARARAIARGAT